MAARIDTHQHFWTFKQENYTWISGSLAPLQRDFGPSELVPELVANSITGTVLVEARGHLEETDNLLGIARRESFVRGVVGWLPLTEPALPGLLERYSAERKLCGLRHWLGPEQDESYMFQSSLHAGLAELEAHGLAYDLMLWPPQLGRAAAFVDRHPRQRFILDHFAKPYIRDGKLEPWRTELRELARRPNVYCKLSGLGTEADWSDWDVARLTPYVDAALEAFTPQRLMFGSDWPVCTLATSYTRWVSSVEQLLAALSNAEQERIFGGTAVEAYGLELV